MFLEIFRRAFFIAGDATIKPINERAKWFEVRHGRFLRER
jgi:hypothetical protein